MVEPTATQPRPQRGETSSDDRRKVTRQAWPVTATDTNAVGSMLSDWCSKGGSSGEPSRRVTESTSPALSFTRGSKWRVNDSTLAGSDRESSMGSCCCRGATGCCDSAATVRVVSQASAGRDTAGSMFGGAQLFSSTCVEARRISPTMAASCAHSWRSRPVMEALAWASSPRRSISCSSAPRPPKKAAEAGLSAGQWESK